VGDLAGEGNANANLGNAHGSLGDFSQAIHYHTQCLEIAKEVGDRAGEGRANGNLGTCHMHLNEHVKTVAYFEAQQVMATYLGSVVRRTKQLPPSFPSLFMRARTRTHTGRSPSTKW
jgi:hypothetical protein